MTNKVKELWGSAKPTLQERLSCSEATVLQVPTERSLPSLLPQRYVGIYYVINIYVICILCNEITIDGNFYFDNDMFLRPIFLFFGVISEIFRAFCLQLWVNMQLSQSGEWDVLIAATKSLTSGIACRRLALLAFNRENKRFNCAKNLFLRQCIIQLHVYIRIQ